MQQRVKVQAYSKDSSERGLFADGKILKGEHIFMLEGHVINMPTRTSIQIGEVSHLDWGENAYFGFFNHSCNPNCAIDIDTLNVYALRDIEDGEELYFNYNSTEFNMTSPFDCLCGSSNCVKRIRGYKYLTSTQKESINKYAADHVLILDRK